MYEQRNHPLLSRAKFARRVARRLLLALFLVGIALGLGVFGYHYIGGLNWIDSLQRLHDLRRHGAGRSAPFGRGKAFRIRLCIVLRTRFRRYRRIDDWAVCTPAPAPFSHRRKMRE